MATGNTCPALSWNKRVCVGDVGVATVHRAGRAAFLCGAGRAAFLFLCSREQPPARHEWGGVLGNEHHDRHGIRAETQHPRVPADL